MSHDHFETQEFEIDFIKKNFYNKMDEEDDVIGLTCSSFFKDNKNKKLLEEEIEMHLKTVDANINLEDIDFEKFARLIAILLEELNNPSK